MEILVGTYRMHWLKNDKPWKRKLLSSGTVYSNNSTDNTLLNTHSSMLKQEKNVKIIVKFYMFDIPNFIGKLSICASRVFRLRTSHNSLRPHDLDELDRAGWHFPADD